MADEKYLILKNEVEAELGRPIQQDEEIELKGLYYFGRGLKLKNHLESEPERLGDICERVLLEIKQRMEQTRRKHRTSIFGAVKDFVSGRTSSKRHRAKKKQRQGKLW